MIALTDLEKEWIIRKGVVYYGVTKMVGPEDKTWQFPQKQCFEWARGLRQPGDWQI